MDIQVEVIGLRLINGDRPLRGFADIQLSVMGETWTVRDWRIEKRDGQRIAVSSPLTSWKDPQTRQLKFKAIFTIPAELRQTIEIAVINAFQGAMEKDREKASRG